MVKIELTEEEAGLFVSFRKYQDQFKILLDNGIFDAIVGSKIIHKDGHGIRMIETTIIRRI